MTSIPWLRDILLAGRNADGGWGYSSAKASRLEPTCWALLALAPDLPAADMKGVLERWPAREGLLLERQGGEPNYAFHALALITLTALGIEHTTGNARLAAALEKAAGIALAPSSINRQRNSLQGWSWVDGTFSWVEPTAWALVALRKAAAVHPPDPARIAEARTLLVDRMCVQGGWNYGNSNMLGRELRPYVPTTAIALVALQRMPEASDAAERSRLFLASSAATEVSSYALSLALIALRVLGGAPPGLAETLHHQVATTCDIGHQLGAAQALYALRTDHDHGAFRI
jgi:hypothetical protein